MLIKEFWVVALNYLGDTEPCYMLAPTLPGYCPGMATFDVGKARVFKTEDEAALEASRIRIETENRNKAKAFRVSLEISPVA